MNLTVDQLIGTYYIKYNRLQGLIYNHYARSNANKISLIIDMSKLLRSIAHGSVDYYDPVEVASLFINMGAHYRQFFRNLNVETEIYFVASTINDSTNTINKTWYKDYSLDKGKPYDANIKTVVDIMSLCSAIPNTYMLHTDMYESGVLIETIIEESNNPVIILSKDDYLFQLVFSFVHTDSSSNIISRDVSLLYPIKNNGEDFSVIIGQGTKNYNDTLSFYLSVNKVNEKITLGDNFSTQILLPIIMAATKVPSRNIKSYIPANSILKFIKYMIDNNKYDLVLIGLKNFVEEYNKYTKGKKIDLFEFQYRYNAVSIFHQKNIATTSLPAFNPYNLYDVQGLKELNETYFKKYPLDLNAL